MKVVGRKGHNKKIKLIRPWMLTTARDVGRTCHLATFSLVDGVFFPRGFSDQSSERHGLSANQYGRASYCAKRFENFSSSSLKFHCKNSDVLKDYRHAVVRRVFSHGVFLNNQAVVGCRVLRAASATSTEASGRSLGRREIVSYPDSSGEEDEQENEKRECRRHLSNEKWQSKMCIGN